MFGVLAAGFIGLVAYGNKRAKRIQATWNAAAPAMGLRHLPEMYGQFDGQDIVVGDPDFDDKFVIKGKDPGRVKEILIDDARAGLRELQETAGDLVVTDRSVLMKLGRLVTDESELARLFDTVTQTANHMVS